jgi:4'-phosphopantetheinyl transferase
VRSVTGLADAQGSAPTPRVSTPVPPLVPGVCQVWWARREDAGPQHDALLGEAALRRRARLVWAADQQRFTAAWAVARLVLGAHAGIPPVRLEIDRTCPDCGAQHGKPWLPAVPEVAFSISHSGSCVAVAVLRDHPVGVDVEEVGRFDAAELDQLAAATLAAEERAELARQPVEGRALAFTTYWTRKEAVLKATGEGVTAQLDRLVVSPPSAQPLVLRRDGATARVSLSVHPLHPPHGYVAALAAAGEGPADVVEHDAAPILRLCTSL